MQLLSSPEPVVRLAEALRQMSDALFILDELDAPSEIATSLDLAILRLSRSLKHEPVDRKQVHLMLQRLEQAFAAI